MNYIALDHWDLMIAASLLLINGGLSLALSLGLVRSLLIAAIRMTVQLLLVGLVLEALFTSLSPLWTALAVIAMLLFAGREVMARQRHRLRGFWSYGLGTGAMAMASVVVTAFALTTQVAPEPWYHPQYAVPLLGMVLGNTMTGVGLALDALTSGLITGRAGVEARLALGETISSATLPAIRTALRTALMPTVNAMSATGLVTLPGMMTGQILSGIEPQEAVKYQLLVMFLISGGTAIGSIAAVYGGVWRLTDRRHRLRLDRLSVPSR
jgi:putative ABC transport system permease protein